MKDLHNVITPVRVRSPAAAGTTGTKAGVVVDLAGYESCEFIIQSGAQTTEGITVTPIVKSGSATGSLSAVADAQLLGTEAEAAAVLAGAAGANQVARIGYIGSDRYVTCDLVVAGAATGIYGVVCVKGSPRKSPAA